MVSLPAERVTTNIPFNYVGTDFCDPFFIRYAEQRKGTFYIVYLTLFIRFITKAAHLELVPEQTPLFAP